MKKLLIPQSVIDKLPEKVDVTGFGINRSVFVNEVQLDPTESIAVLGNPQNAFNWGYHSQDGPKKLAYAILRKYMTPKLAMKHCEMFMFAVTGSLDPTNFRVVIELQEFFRLFANGSKTPYTNTIKKMPLVAFEEIESRMSSVIPVEGDRRGNIKGDSSRKVANQQKPATDDMSLETRGYKD